MKRTYVSLLTFLFCFGCSTYQGGQQTYDDDAVFQRYFPHNQCMFEVVDYDGRVVANMILFTQNDGGTTKMSLAYKFIDLVPDYEGWRVKVDGMPCGIIELRNGQVSQHGGYHTFGYNFATGLGSIIDNQHAKDDKKRSYILRLKMNSGVPNKTSEPSVAPAPQVQR